MDDHTHQDDSHDSLSHSRVNLLPIIIIFGIIFILFRYDIKSIANNPQLNKNISYVKVTISNWWHEAGIPKGQGVFSKFFKTDNMNPLNNTPGITSFIDSFKGVDNISDAKNIIENTTKEAIKDEATKQLNTWANNSEFNTTNEVVPTHQ